MALDIIAGIVVIWGFVRGWRRGFLYQLGSIGMLAIAFVVARSTDDLVEPWLAEHLDVSPQTQTLLAFFGVFLVVYFLGALVLRSFVKDVHGLSDTLSGGDRVLGTLVGGMKGLMVVYLAILGLIMVHQTSGRLPVPYASSVSGRWVMQHNFLESEEFPRARALLELGWLLHGSDTGELADNPHFKAILEHPKAEILREPEVAAAMARGDWVEVLSHDGVWDLLDEPEIQEHLNAIERSDRFSRGAQERRAPGSEEPEPAETPPGGDG